MKLNLGCGSDWLKGFENLDRRVGWTFESGLPFNDESVQGVTISHALMYVLEPNWPRAMAECFRVLAPGGVIRITEDDMESDTSKRKHNPWPGMVTRTGPSMLRKHLEDAGFTAHDVTRDETHFRDRSLIQAWRSENPPYYFFMEGVKPQAASESAERPRSGWTRRVQRGATRSKIASLRMACQCVDAVRGLSRRRRAKSLGAPVTAPK